MFDRNKNAEIRKLLGLEPLSSVIKKGRQFGHVQNKTNEFWLQSSMMSEVFINRWKEHPRRPDVFASRKFWPVQRKYTAQE